MTDLSDHIGICLKSDHFEQILERKPAIGWFELHPENYMGDGGLMHYYLDRISQCYPLSFHSVGLSLGSAHWKQHDHLHRLKQLVERYQPLLVSDHLSWSYGQAGFFNDLLPLPYTQESLTTVCNNIDLVQNTLNRTILIENPSTYFTSKTSDMSEVSFLTQVCERTSAKLLLDVNNIYVSSVNNGGNSDQYIQQIPPEAVSEIHLAGHAEEILDNTTLLIDDHSCRICDQVWGLYQQAIKHCGQHTPTLIEWDTDVPTLQILLEEADKARTLSQESDVI